MTILPALNFPNMEIYYCRTIKYKKYNEFSSFDIYITFVGK